MIAMTSEYIYETSLYAKISYNNNYGLLVKYFSINEAKGSSI